MPKKKLLSLFLALILIFSLFSFSGITALAGSETVLSDQVTYGTKTDAASGAYTYVNIKGLTPYVYMPTGAGSGTVSDFTNVTGMMNDYGKANNIVVAINAGIFYNAGVKTQYCFNYKEADGVVIADGAVLKSNESIDHTNCDILVIDENGSVGWTDYYADADALAAGKGYYYDIHGKKVEGKKIISAVTGFVPVLVDGKALYDPADTSLNGYDNFVGHYTQKAVRQIFGVKTDGSYGILTNSTTWTLADAGSAAKAEGFVFAYNLDGGGSAETVVASGSGNDYTIKTLVSQLRGTRPLPSYIVFTADNKAPVSASAQAISAKLSSETFDSSITLADLVKYLTVTETFGNANGKTSSRTVYSQQGLDMSQKLSHTLVGGATTMAACQVKNTDTSPNGTLVYTKTDNDVAMCLMANSNTRQDGKYYDYSTGYTLSASDTLSTAGLKEITVSYIPGAGQDALTCKVNITVNSAGSPSPKFSDVGEGDWFYASVMEMCGKGLMKGVSDSKFDPNGGLTRGMVVAVLYRFAGEPTAAAASPFTDITEDWYRAAVNWAYAEGIVNGQTVTSFAPKASINREQLVTMLYRYAKFAGEDVGQNTDKSYMKYNDWKSISGFALDAMNWAINAKIITGTTQTSISPNSPANRAQLAAIMDRFCDLAA